MTKMRLGMVLNVVALLLLLGFCSASDYKWRKAMISGETSSSMMMNRDGSSVLLPLYGNVYPIGYYNVIINIGQPSKPYFLHLDTGSDFTWLQCDVHCVEESHPFYRPSIDLVPCKDPLCESLHPPGEHKCDNPHRCDYEVEYADGSSSHGVLVRDVFALNYTNGTPLKPCLALGCGYDQPSGTSHDPLDGILGLGRGKTSIISQLYSQSLVRNVFGHCLSGTEGGFLFFGDGLYDSPRIVWTSMSSELPKFYSPGFAELVFNGKAVGLKDLIAVFDSGSSYTYFNSLVYQNLLYLMNNELAGQPLEKATDDQTLAICWKGQKPFKSVRDVTKFFKSISLIFTSNGAKTQFELPPESYLIISNKKNVCLGILNGTQAGLNNLNVIGDISMQDRMVIYDNEKQLIGWAPANCDQLPKPKYAYT
ncbi:hypothetical protein SLEP1_g42404 [Rubroshorea leprosula]|uniref:Aspartic proteinase Asp1 n=1 Tax=Rubroshorea leprosula TaxID=152421 RepID=A0AAV5L9R1_9ROSI|nr:hypothetical protein SLEP1_g42404 [Rubroshorea leprosula]